MDPYGTYYAQTRRQGKLIRQSLKTTDRKLAERKLRDFLERAARIRPGSGNVTFADMVQRFRETELAVKDLKPRGREYREYCIESLLRKWPDLTNLPVRNITRSDCERWFAKRREKISTQLLNNELGTLKMILEFAVREGIVMDNPARSLKRLKIPRSGVIIPTREQFARLVHQLHETMNMEAANFVELLAYSGMRRNEAASLTWGDVDFERGQFKVTGGEQGTKNRQARHVPLFPAMRSLLERIQMERGTVPLPNKPIMLMKQCRYSIKNACKKAGLPHFNHHHMRHFFTSNAIEQGVDFKVIASWLGHSDGGILVAKTYGHLRQQHSEAMAQKMTFDATVQPKNILSFQKVGEK